MRKSNPQLEEKTNAAIVFITCIVCSVISFIFGFSASQLLQSNNTIGNMTAQSYEKVKGIYSRKFLNKYDKSVESYIVLKEDGTCKYISMIASEYTSGLDLSTMDENCTYSFDSKTNTGEFPAGKLTFNIESKSIMLGGAIYNKIK